MEPYYQQAGITIYHGDARELLFVVPRFDVLVTDPPYGVDLGFRSGAFKDHGLAHEAYASYVDSADNFRSQIVPIVSAAILRARRAAVFMSGRNLPDMPRNYVVGGVYFPVMKARHSWGFNCFQPILFYGQSPTVHLGCQPAVLYTTDFGDKSNGHPCPKPLSWLHWLVRFSSLPAETIADPFMGSGTTLVAAKMSGRQAVGIEIEERYCEIAARRLQQDVLPFDGPPIITPKTLELAFTE